VNIYGQRISIFLDTGKRKMFVWDIHVDGDEDG
jgi:hypothetical protein